MLPDQTFAHDILEAIYTTQEAALELNTAIISGGGMSADTIGTTLMELLATLKSSGYELGKSDKTIKLGGAAESALVSLERILVFLRTEPELALHKLEFELFPMLQVMYGSFYFWACVFPNKNKMRNYYENERLQLFSNKYIDDAVQRGSYKYDISIFVLAYNKLDYTKMCMENLLANIPSGLNYELILINHGSTDGTKKYFESVKPHKQVDIEVNGCDLLNVQDRIVEGEYWLEIANDVLITPHAIENMLRAMREDESIGFLVPTTPNVSNLQMISANYSDFDKLKDFAEQNNRYDPFRHEMRTRLVNPISLFRTKAILSSEGIPIDGYWFTANDGSTASFPDDLTSMLFRRAGYKNILAKDAYCHHFGSVTIKDDIKKKQMNAADAYHKGRIDFKAAFGIDPWGTGFCYDHRLAEAFVCKFNGHIEVLGINCGLGSNSLKIKELYKEHKHNLDVTLTNVTSDESVLPDLLGVSDSAAMIRKLSDAFKKNRDKKYHYIVFEDKFKGIVHNWYDVSDLLARLISGGELYIKCDAEVFNGKLDSITQIGDWIKITRA